MARRVITDDAEVLPEADRLAEYPHPRETKHLYGNEVAQAELAAAIDNGAMHHAWLLTGKEGIGKATLAYRAAVYALADDGERTPLLKVRAGIIAERQVIRLSHPGLLVIRRGYDVKTKRFPSAITVDEVRKLRSFLSHRHGPGQWRVVIIDRADELNLNAANALLKSLEEPPPLTVFFLIAIDAGKLLPTIRSRCRLLPLSPLSQEHTIAAAQAAFAAAHLEGEGKEPDLKEPDWSNIASAAAGSPRRMLALVSENGNEITQAVERIYSSLGALDISFQHTLAQRLSGNQAHQDYELFLTLLFEKLASLIKAAALQPAGNLQSPAFLGAITPQKLASWAELWETLHREQREVQALNLDRGAFLLDIFARLERASQS